MPYFALVLVVLAIVSCGTAATAPVAVGAEIRWLLDKEHPSRLPVLLVGDTLTFRPELVDAAGGAISTTLDEWVATFDPVVLSLDAFRVRALAPTPPGRSTTLAYTHQPTRLVAAITVVVLAEP